MCTKIIQNTLLAANKNNVAPAHTVTHTDTHKVRGGFIFLRGNKSTSQVASSVSRSCISVAV